MYQAIHHSLEKGVGHEDLQGPLEGTNLPGDACLVLTTDPKPRLRWTAELHERFVDAVTQLGGPDTVAATGLSENQGTSSTSRMVSQEMNDGYQVTEALRVQMEVQRRLHEQLEVQRHLQLRIEAQGKYLQSILEKACRVLADQNMASTSLDAARQELSELAIKVSGDCLNAPETANLASFSEIAAVCLDEKSINRQTQITDCSVDSCLTSNDSSGRVSAVGLQAGGKKRTRPIYCDSESLVWESDARQDVQWMASI
ncbi:Myb family transcription factor [Nymphaea thermarum]|nr:Myb family transcription factor [Nymphaea thermarum]